MQTTTKTSRAYWITPATGVAVGLVYLIAFSIGGQPGNGLIGLGVMVAFSAAVVLLGRRSETVRGILDHRDERLAGIDLRATAVTAVVMILAVLAGFVIEVAPRSRRRTVCAHRGDRRRRVPGRGRLLPDPRLTDRSTARGRSRSPPSCGSGMDSMRATKVDLAEDGDTLRIVRVEDSQTRGRRLDPQDAWRGYDQHDRGSAPGVGCGSDEPPRRPVVPA